MRTHVAGLSFAVVVMLSAAFAVAQEAAPAAVDINLVAALSNVRWQGQPPTAEMIQNKSSVVLVYAAWCPKCNEWSPELFKQIKEAALESPVTVFAINADKTEPGFSYVAERGLVAPNIIHGYDPGMPARLGFESELFNYVVFDPTGKPIEKAYAGMRQQTATGIVHTVAAKARSGGYPGEFAILSREMSPQLKQLLWPIELGQPVTDKALTKLRGKLPADQHSGFNTAIRDYLDKHLKRCEEGAAGEVPQQIEAYNSAKLLAERFSTTTQGRKAREIVTNFDDDEQFKKEQFAAVAYQKAAAGGGSPSAMKRSLVKLGNRFAGTHYGDLASQQANAASQ